MDLFAQMLAALGFSGLCCVNYKLVDGNPMIFEINPRCGFSLCAHFPQVLDALQPRWWRPLARVFTVPRTPVR
jgi:D-alanine-D-alanine ligase-like ATP-grasp enzyme